LCQSLYLLVLAAVLAAIWPRTARAHSGFDEMWPVGALLLGYGLLWNFFGHLVRGRLGPAVAANNAARVLLPILFLAACLLPALVDVFVHGEIGSWHVGYVLNPFATVQHFAPLENHGSGLTTMLALLGGAVLLQVPFWWRGVREVLVASAARRAADAGPVATVPAATEPRA